MENGISEILKFEGENTAFASKCHFKSADLKKSELRLYNLIILLTLLVSALLQLVEMADILSSSGVSQNITNLLHKIFSVFTVCITIGVLVVERNVNFETNHGFINKHMEVGEKYLSIHKDLHYAFCTGETNRNKIADITNELKELNKSPKPMIPEKAKKKAKKSIEVDGEMTIWWK